MEYIIGGIVALTLVVIMKIRTTRLRVRNEDPLQHELLDALVERLLGKISDEDLRKILHSVEDIASDSPHNLGDSMHTRLAHAASLAPYRYRDKNMVRAITDLAKQIAVSTPKER